MGVQRGIRTGYQIQWLENVQRRPSAPTQEKRKSNSTTQDIIIIVMIIIIIITVALPRRHFHRVALHPPGPRDQRLYVPVQGRCGERKLPKYSTPWPSLESNPGPSSEQSAILSTELTSHINWGSITQQGSSQHPVLHWTQTRVENPKFLPLHVNCDAYKYSFWLRTIWDWDILLPE